MCILCGGSPTHESSACPVCGSPRVPLSEPAPAPEPKPKAQRKRKPKAPPEPEPEPEAQPEPKPKPEGPTFVDLGEARDARDPVGSYRDPFARKNLAAMTSAFASCGFEFRFNTRSLGIEYLTDGKWLRLDDRYAASAQETIGARFFIKTERGPRLPLLACPRLVVQRLS